MPIETEPMTVRERREILTGDLRILKETLMSSLTWSEIVYALSEHGEQQPQQLEELNRNVLAVQLQITSFRKDVIDRHPCRKG